MGLHDAAARAARLVRSLPVGTRWFLACDSDADGLCAAGVAALALRRAGHRFQVRASRDKTEQAYEALADVACDALMVLDKGSSHLDTLAEVGRATGRPVVVLDHHNLPDAVPGDIVLVNPRAEGMDGSRDASAATVAAAFALALDDANLDLGPTALAGAIGDWQHEGGWRGWNAELVDRCRAAGHIRQRRVPDLVGVDLAEALGRARPPWSRFHGRDAAARALGALGIDATLETEELDDDATRSLLDALVLDALAAGQDADPDHLLRSLHVDARTGFGLRHLFRIIDACGRRGEAATGLALLAGHDSARNAALACFQAYKTDLVAAVERLRRDGTTCLAALQWTHTKRPELTGMVGGLGMTHFLDDRSRPVLVAAPRPDGDVQVSTRGTHEQVAAGLDLGRAVSRAAVGVGREGGGHPIAAGTVVAPADLERFVAALDEALEDQGFLDRTPRQRS